MNVLDYSVEDLQFAHWLRRKREMLGERPVGTATPPWLDAELDRLRPLRNPELSCLV